MSNEKKEMRCKYCGSKIDKYRNVCGNCYQKLKLIRKIKRMLTEGRSEVNG